MTASLPSIRIRSTRSIGLIAAALVCVLAPAMPAAGASDPDPETSVAALSAWRTSVSPALAPVAYDAAKSEGCRLHAEHWRLNGIGGHAEPPGTPGYTEAGNRAAGSSVLSSPLAHSAGPLDWAEAPYHRVQLLNPWLASSGFWAEHGMSCMGSHGSDPARATQALQVLPYPAGGTLNASHTFNCNESPNPCDLFGGPEEAGGMVTVQFNGPTRWPASPTLTAATLTPDDGSPAELTVVDGTHPMAGLMAGGVGLFPHRPLGRGQWYTAHIAGLWTSWDHDIAIPFDHTWRFRTAVGPPLGSSAEIVALRRSSGRRARVRVLAPAELAGRRMRVRVRPLRWAGGRAYGGRWSTRRITLSRAGTASFDVEMPRRLGGRRGDGVDVRVPTLTTQRYVMRIPMPGGASWRRLER